MDPFDSTLETLRAQAQPDQGRLPHLHASRTRAGRARRRCQGARRSYRDQRLLHPNSKIEKSRRRRKQAHVGLVGVTTSDSPLSPGGVERNYPPARTEFVCRQRERLYKAIGIEVLCHRYAGSLTGPEWARSRALLASGLGMVLQRSGSRAFWHEPLCDIQEM